MECREWGWLVNHLHIFAIIAITSFFSRHSLMTFRKNERVAI